MSASLVGSEMCIRDREVEAVVGLRWWATDYGLRTDSGLPPDQAPGRVACLLYTSDAADDM
eukprot:11818894-Alexandrium_andersonii.AAC.1